MLSQQGLATTDVYQCHVDRFSQKPPLSFVVKRRGKTPLLRVKISTAKTQGYKEPFMKNLFLVVCLMFLSNISVVNAEFKLDISINDLDKSLEIISINDLAVGESAYIPLRSICIKSDGNIAISRETRIESERSDYSTYALIKIQPGSTISLN
jgi:hypothetical protein